MKNIKRRQLYEKDFYLILVYEKQDFRKTEIDIEYLANNFGKEGFVYIFCSFLVHG